MAAEAAGSKSRATRGGLFDVIIVGAGASGCVLAGRLSETSDRHILLIEAGPDSPAGEEDPEVLDPYPASSSNPKFHWAGLSAEAGADPSNGSPRVTTPYIQGFGVGGGSSINGMAADRGQPADYDEWRDLGVRGWGWNEVLPYFRKLESDANFAGALHGTQGAIPVRRLAIGEWAPLAKGFADFFTRGGAAMVEDYTGDFRDGLSSVPMSCLADRRVSASMAYLAGAVRRRHNLTILANARVERLVFRDGGVRGVEARTAAGPAAFSAPEVIVACGAIHSPTLLLRSGIGPAAELRALGIEVVRDLPGVGRNLQNHPIVTLALHLPQAGRQPHVQRAWQQNQLRYSSKLAGCAEHDMLLLLSNKVGWHRLGCSVGAVGVIVLKAYSQGTVELASRDAAVAPQVRFNLLADERDFERLARGVRTALEFLGDEKIMRLRNEVFMPDGVMASLLARHSRINALLAWLIACLLRVGPLRRVILRRRTLDIGSMMRSEQAIGDYVRRNAQAAYHACGSCRMGGGDDPGTVVDPDCRVRGVAGLRVIDASVFPSVPRGFTHFPVLMAAEKMADRIKAAWLDQGGRGTHVA